MPERCADNKCKCPSCGDVFVLKEDEDGWQLNCWTDSEDRIYCDQCFYELYSEPEEKALENWDSENKKSREDARNKINKLNKFWGTA